MDLQTETAYIHQCQVEEDESGRPENGYEVWATLGLPKRRVCIVRVLAGWWECLYENTRLGAVLQDPNNLQPGRLRQRIAGERHTELTHDTLRGEVVVFRGSDDLLDAQV
jgi:hypothetical protein